MSDLVLVRYDLGDEYELTPRGRAFAEAHGLTVVEESAYLRSGHVKRPARYRKRTDRPAKPKTSTASVEKKAAQSAEQSDSPSSEE